MNTATIAALYNPYVAQLLSTATPAAAQELAATLELRREDATFEAHHEVRIRHFAPIGISLNQRCSPRVFAWACAQLPAADQRQPEGESWSAMTADYTNKGEFTLRYHAGSAFAMLLRGMQHYQRKLNRRTRKQLAQLRAYHTQQQAAAALRATMQAAAPAEPLLPTYGITHAEYWRRVNTAEDLGEQFEKEGNGLSNSLSSEILWHPNFPTGCVRSFSRMPLYEVEAFLGNNLAEDFNVGRPLDRADYLYVADVLREGLADNPTPLAALRLARALAWVEQAAEALLPTKQPLLTAAQSEVAVEVTPSLAA